MLSKAFGVSPFNVEIEPTIGPETLAKFPISKSITSYNVVTSLHSSWMFPPLPFAFDFVRKNSEFQN